MTPSNLTVKASIREWQKHFNQAFNLSQAAQDVTYSSTQTIAGGLIICRNFTVNPGVTLTISNPTTIICQTFTNNGTITMSAVDESVLFQYRSTDAARIPKQHNLAENAPGVTHPSATATANVPRPAGSGGCSFGYGGFGGIGSIATANNLDGLASGTRSLISNGWKQVGMALWWPISYFRNPVLAVGGGGSSSDKPYLSCSLAWQTKGGVGYVTSGSANSFIQFSAEQAGGNPGSFLEVYARVSAINSATGSISAIGAGGGASGSQASGGGGGGGGVGIYSESTLSQLGTINVSGGAGGGGTGGNGGGGGGGGIFLTAPTIVNSGTNTVAGGAGGAGGQTGLAGQAGLVIVEPYLRLWMPGEDDVVQGTRYQSANV